MDPLLRITLHLKFVFKDLKIWFSVGFILFVFFLYDILFKDCIKIILNFVIFQKSQASAQQSINVLNERIEQKDTTIKKYQEMLRDLRLEAKTAREKHEHERNSLNREHSSKVMLLLFYRIL